jgi:hypothetical protein
VITRLGPRVRSARWVGVLAFALLAFGSAVAAQPPRPDSAAKAAARDLPLTAEQRQAFAGTYAVAMPQGGETTLRIFEEGGVLKARPGDQGEARRLLYQGENVFRAEGMAEFTFTFVLEAGRAVRFTARRPDGVMQGTRVP